jgi:hypothetical protein
MTAAGSLLSLKHTSLAIACGAGLCAAVGAQASAADAMSQWREYARRGLTPEYSFEAPTGPNLAPTLLSSHRELRSLGEVKLGFAQPEGLTLSVDFANSAAGSFDPAPVAERRLLSPGRGGINSEFVSSSLGLPFLGEGRVSLTAVVARQRYASAGFGAAPWGAQEELTGLRGHPLRHEVSTGHGVRVEYDSPLNEYLDWNLAAQSKLDMDAFESYRGVYSDAGDFDIPGRLRTGVTWKATRSLALGLGVERVFYSQIDAFTSAALPTRFLSLLGDGSSPVFAWQDLTVYSAESRLTDRSGADWVLRWTTRQQPSPTSALLERALEKEFTNTNLALGYRRALGDFGHLWVAASYAPSQYFLGAVPYARRNLAEGAQVEFEALWSIPF